MMNLCGWAVKSQLNDPSSHLNAHATLGTVSFLVNFTLE